MKQRLWLTIVRWLCVLPAVALSFLASVLFARHVDPLIYNELLRRGVISLHSFGGYSIDLFWDGPLAAIFFVLAGAWVAPGHRRVVALALFGLGAFLTPGLVADSNIQLYGGVDPDVERLRTICMHWTIAITYVGGALAVACVFIATRRSAARPAPIPPCSTSAARPA